MSFIHCPVDGNEIWVVSENETLSVLDVSVIQEVDNTVRIMSPELAKGMKVVTSNLPVMTKGMKVRIINQDDISSS